MGLNHAVCTECGGEMSQHKPQCPMYTGRIIPLVDEQKETTDQARQGQLDEHLL